jgi:hypothetical protein
MDLGRISHVLNIGSDRLNKMSQAWEGADFGSVFLGTADHSLL